MLKSQTTKIVAALIMASLPFFTLAQGIDPAFNPNQLVSDKTFSDTQTFGGAEGIQKFLVYKNSVLANTNPEFLVKLKEPSVAIIKQGLNDPEPNLPQLRTAAQLIWDASQQSGLNPQVILATLNKEQGLITSKTDPSDPALQKALDHAMGFNCPDGSGCGNLFPGFYYQLFGNFDSNNNRYLGAANSLMKSFSAPNGRGPLVDGQTSQVGSTITLDNTLGGFDNVPAQQQVTLLNKATAALYRYTPHVFNGNYNFWRFFVAWFKYQNGSLLKLSNSNAIYIIQNGLKLPVPQFVATARALNLDLAMPVSQNELDNFQTDKPYGPVDNTLVKSDSGNKFVFIDSVPHPVSNFVIKQRGLNPDLAYNITSDELSLFTLGTVLPPKDGTIIRGVNNKTVYLVSGGEIKMYSGYTFAQNKITPKQIVSVPDAEILTYTPNGFVPPLDGSLVKSSADNTVYLIQSGTKQPILGVIFKNRGFSIKQIGVISTDEVASLPVGNYAAPKDYTFFTVDSKTGPLYEYKSGTKHSISDFVAKQRGIKGDYVFGSNVVSGWVDGIPVPPKDGTIVKGDSDNTIYSVISGQLRPMSYEYYLKKKITPKKIVTLPQDEIDSYAKGDTLN